MTKMAAEVGGTYTDFIWIDDDGAVRTHKTPSTPEDPSIAVMEGLSESLGEASGRLSLLVHGSTVATNAVLERKGCRAALVTTRGFRDLLTLQRQVRPNVYAVACHKPEPLIPLSRVIEADERIDAGGEVVRPLDGARFLADLEALMDARRPEALAVCLLHAYHNAEHERRVRELVREAYPDLPVILSSEVLPTFREYERASTTAIAAYLAPLVDRYLHNLERFVAERNERASLFIMQSSGGVVPSAGARDRAVDLLNSGPAAGVIAATRVAELVDDSRIITLDVGGTSADVCLVVDGEPEVAADSEVDGLPVGVSGVDIANVGAGGGSIGRVDAGGMLQVGPHSAGARPGPACYGRGGTEATLTDAMAHLGWIRAHRFLGGRMTLDTAKAADALAALGGRLGQDAGATAGAMVDIAAAHMSRCVRLVSVQRGHDPKAYALYGYGGMGPMLAALTAEDLRIDRVVVPPHPGLFSSFGLLVADLKRIYRETRFLPVDDAAPAEIDATFERLRAQALEEFRAYGHDASEVESEFILEMRYRGQGYELLVPVDPARVTGDGPAYLKARFREAHHQSYGTNPAKDAVDVVTFRLVARVPGSREVVERLRARKDAGEPESETDDIVFAGETRRCRFLARESLPEGYRVDGLAVIEEPTATTLVPPGWRARVGAAGALILERGEER